MGLNEFLSAFENLKIANVEASDLKMVFGIFDLQKKSEINYSVFLQELFQPLPPVRERIVIDAFKHID